MQYRKEILRKNKGLVCFYVCIGLACSLLGNFKASYFQEVVDGLADRSVSLLQILFYGALLCSVFLLEYLDNYPAKRLEHGFFLDFKLLALKKISRIDYSEYQRLGTGKLVQRVENGAEAGRNILFHFWLQLFPRLIPTAFFSLCFIWRISRPVTLGILAGYVIVFLVTNLLLKSLYRIKEKILVNEELLNHFLVRCFMEMPVFRMARQFFREFQKAEETKEQIVHAKTKMTMIHEAFFTIFALLVAFLNVGVLRYAWSTGTLSVGAVVALLSLLDNAYTPVAIFNALYVQYKLDRASFRRYEEFLSAKDDMQLTTGKCLPACEGNISIHGLSFSYGERQIFHGLNLSIKKGEKVALVGESGSGKSTLLKLLSGLLKYKEGSIQIDGEDVKLLRLTDLYEKISYLSQDSTVFDGSLRENIAFEKKVSEEALLHAIKEVRLMPWYRTLEHGMETSIGERGAVLSGGERQRVALARLWLEQKGLTILDEATSALDNLTEKAIIDRILTLLEAHTVIAVTHKLDSAAAFDRIILFQEGEIVGEGSFSELLRENQYFAQLYQANQQSTD